MSRGAPGFRRLRRGAVELWVDPRFEEAALELGLLEPDALERLLRGRPGEGGRGPTTRLPLGAGGARLLLRLVLHGGALGPLLGDVVLRMGRPRKELEITASLRAAGAPVPAPVLAVGRRRLGPLWRAAVGTRVEEDTESARGFLEGGPSEEDVLRAAQAAARAVRRFHDAGGAHADLHLGNLLLRRTPGGFEALVIDLDRARRLPSVSASRRMAELARLYRSVVKRGLTGRLGSRGAALFFSAYVDGDDALARALAAHLGRERRRLRLHALRYPRPSDRERPATGR